LLYWRCLEYRHYGFDMVQLKLDYHASTPLYHQITEQVRKLIATGQLKPGDHLPTVRQLAKTLNVNQNTVVRAYMELEEAQVVVSRRGGGTIVTAEADDPSVRLTRQKWLADTISDDIIRVLSQGYSPEELEATFYLYLERWREERQASGEKPAEAPPARRRGKTIRIVGSNDLALNMLLNLLRQREEGINTEVTHAGSLGGLIALQEDRADLAGIHLLDEETGEYNYPYIKRILPNREVAVVNLAYRIQGLMFASGNPRQIQGITDLKRSEITFVNRQRGAGTRILLDLELRKQGIAASDINGYGRERDTHMAVATDITNGQADVGLGIEAAAQSCGLGFRPLFRERYDLVIPIKGYRSRLLKPMLEIIASEEFKKLVDQIGGYDTSQTGATTFL
jgi:molybdate-binding protein/DNA-binding transcriptional regulator YhcF (GntR family)